MPTINRPTVPANDFLGRTIEVGHTVVYEPWEKPFQNMRSSRESELVDQFPLPVVCKWIGNSPKVAEQHYLQQLEKDFERAASTYTALDTKPADFSRSVKRRTKIA
jgi:hypothetical protein